VICFHALFIVYFFGLWLAGTKRNLDNEKKECMGEMKVDGFGRKVKLRQLLLIFGCLDVMCLISDMLS